jgi:predicted Zn-dependent protease
MSLNQTLTRARACVQRGQVDAAIKLYRGLLVSMAHHPQINTELGVLLLQHRRSQDAIAFLNKAVTAAPAAFEPWVFLVIAHQRCGDLLRARQVLAQMQAQGFDATRLAVYEQELNEPTPAQLIDSGNHVSAEIAARMMVSDYPSSATARDCLQRVLRQGEPQV